MEEASRDAISKARRTVLTNTSKKVSRVLKRLLLSVPAEADELAAAEAAGARAGAADRARILRRIEAKHEQVRQNETLTNLCLTTWHSPWRNHLYLELCL